MISVKCSNYSEGLLFEELKIKFGPCAFSPFPALKQRPELLQRVQEVTVRRQRGEVHTDLPAQPGATSIGKLEQCAISLF